MTTPRTDRPTPKAGGLFSALDHLMPLSPEARVFCVLGPDDIDVDAIDIINKRFAGRGKDAIWLPMRVAAETFDAVVKTLDLVQNIAGMAIHDPYQSAILPHLDHLSPLARLAGAADVVRRTADGQWEGDIALLDAFRRTLRAEGVDAKGARVWLVGARGGAAAAFALAERGIATLTIADPRIGAATDLAGRVQAAFPRVSASVGVPDARAIDIVIDGAAAGEPENALVAFDPARLRPEALVIDGLARPRMSPFIERSAEAGLATLAGDPVQASLMNLYEEFFGFSRLPYKDATIRHPIGPDA
jgi:shikimate dehydrogenase